MALNTILLFLGDIGGGEIMVIMLAVLLMFGAEKIPGLARSLGKGIREFKDATDGIKNEIERSINDDEPRRRNPRTPVVEEPVDHYLVDHYPVANAGTALEPKDEETKTEETKAEEPK